MLFLRDKVKISVVQEELRCASGWDLDRAEEVAWRRSEFGCGDVWQLKGMCNNTNVSFQKSKLCCEQLKGATIFVPQSRIKTAHSNQGLCRYHCTPERGSDTELYGRREEHFTALPLLRYNLQETPCSLCIVKLQRYSSGSMSCLCFAFLCIVLNSDRHTEETAQHNGCSV